MELTNIEYQEIIAACEGSVVESYFDWDTHLGDWCDPIGFVEFCKAQTHYTGQAIVDAVREAAEELAIFDTADSILGAIVECARELI
jgi:hypothetical protein